jgi:hypothetical protein
LLRCDGYDATAHRWLEARRCYGVTATMRANKLFVVTVYRP